MAGKKILVVEDDNFIREIYSEKLSIEGYNVSSAEDGSAGWAKIKEIRPDLLILDLFMPVMDGFEVLEKISQDEEIKKIPVVVLTNASEPEQIERAKSLGAKDYIVKSIFTPQEVLEKIRKNIA